MAMYDLKKHLYKWYEYMHKLMCLFFITIEILIAVYIIRRMQTWGIS